MPTKPLPARPSLEHLKKQAKGLLTAQRAGAMPAAQRIREFHPRFRHADDTAISRFAFKLSDAQLTIAREYGFPSWPQLKSYIASPDRADLEAPKHERIDDPSFRRAVELLDAGSADELRTWLRENPHLVRQRIALPGSNYFTNPALLEFIAENPTRRGMLPQNIVEVARVILDAGAASDKASLDCALDLVASSSVARECGVQLDLLSLLCSYGANPTGALHAAALYGEFAAVKALIERGATLDLPVAVALGRMDDTRALIPEANSEELDAALAMAANQGHAAIVEVLLDAGAHINRFSPPGSHSHATPLHQAVSSGQPDIVRLLFERGADPTIKDIRYNATPLEWADYLGHSAIAAYLREQS